MTSNPVVQLRRLAKATTALAGTLALTACLGSPGPNASTQIFIRGDGVRSGDGGLPIGVYESDPEYQAMGGLSQVGASTYYNGGSNPNGYTGAGVTVAVFDSGIDFDHPEFIGALSPASSSLVGGTIDDIGRHGTWVAGVIGANRNGVGMHGIAFNSTILALRTDAPGSCPAGCLYSYDTLATATDYAMTQNADILNYSLGGFDPISASFRTALINAANGGALLVAAAGNEYDDDPIRAANPINPAALVATETALQGPMIAAGAWDVGTGDIASFSNRAGTAADYYLLAPGVNIVTTDVGGGYATVSGTSFAAPMIAGAAALLQERFPALTATQIVDILLVSATDQGAPGPDPIYGRGLMNLSAAAAPLGTVTIPTGATVDDGGVDPDDTALGLSAAFGDALTRTSVLASAMFLDGYGRDFPIDLTASIAAPSAGPDLLGYLVADGGIDRFQASLTPHTQIRVQAAEDDGMPAPWLGAALDDEDADDATSFSLRQRIAKGAELTLAQGQGAGGQFGLSGAGAPIGGMLGGVDAGFIGMADSGGNATLSGQLADGVTLRLGVGISEATLGRQVEQSPDGASVFVAEMSHAGASGLRFGLQLGRLLEEGGLLESGGEGGFSLDGTATTDFVTAFGVVPLTDSIDLFGSYTTGQSDAAGLSTDLIGGFDGVRSQSMSLGIAARDLFSGRDRLALTVMQPLRVTDGTATVTAPVARTLDGAVTYQQETVGLAPSGRETDAELSYGFALGAGDRIDLSIVTRIEPDHVQDASPEVAAGIRYRLTF